MENSFVDKVYKTVDYKVEKVDNNLFNYAIRAIAAGMFLTLIYTFVTQLSSDFIAGDASLGVPIAKLLMSYLFGIGLVFIIFMGAELFTSNTMYLTIGVTHKKTTAKKWIKVLVICWVFNFVGAALGAFLLVKTGLFHSGGELLNPYLYELAAKKSTLPLDQIFFRAILANWVVCVVVYIAGVAKDDIGKMFIVPLGLMPFVYLGFEHSIANFGVFLMTWFTPGGVDASYHGELFNTIGAFKNLGVATLGNIIGGAVLVGCYFAFLHRKKINK
ncbi:MAG: formate/nitrite transporter family protein [Erysipelotrichales bacterium]